MNHVQHNSADPASYIPRVNPADYEYTLPSTRIAQTPREPRDSTNLQVISTTGAIEHHTFRELPGLIPPDALLILNNTRVVRARIVSYKETGGRVEFFLLDPLAPSNDPALALAAVGSTTWQCLIGGAKRLHGEHTIEFEHDGAVQELRCTVESSTAEAFTVRFDWNATLVFSEVLELIGSVPLPPYIKRIATDEDAPRYQTVYAEEPGSVAAPTAGLHFTPTILEQLREKDVRVNYVTLHVGAGTFKPIKSETVAEHAMHQERISVGLDTVRAIRMQAERREGGKGSPIVLVGTTSLRTVESLYWFGARLLLEGEAALAEELTVGQWEPYRLAAEYGSLPAPSEALLAIEQWMVSRHSTTLTGVTRILIVPGYAFRLCDALITNFHQPGSTLILLVAAFLGKDRWREAYDSALENGYRFLSYGDSSLLITGRM